ncbi:hypothetical protein BKA58DRAFT_472656 [Alternaria rosae]|uniref:uncharacterized protein n=1 Tax=Alternaria rosae TaxID=1187941 RepID=UPI001E8D1C34|nr:uncharacterized protein BKA58DRAFT_472656 [Alternaria rosae]KAH6860853.1 hypothetical protein BKA58DRAFT_472656 [Alternaria rosae]
MKLSTALSATATFLLMGRIRSLPAEYDDGMSLRDALMMLKSDDGVRVLGYDGVLRRLNVARTGVVDYIQLSARHVEELVAWKYPNQRDTWAGVDGHAVTDEAQLLTVPDSIAPLDPSTMVSKPKNKTMLKPQYTDCRDSECVRVEVCRAFDPPCAECEPFQECVGEPTGCLVRYFCEDTLPNVDVQKLDQYFSNGWSSILNHRMTWILSNVQQCL